MHTFNTIIYFVFHRPHLILWVGPPSPKLGKVGRVRLGPRLYRKFSCMSFISYFVIPASTGGQAHFESNIPVKIFLRHFLPHGGSSTEQKTFLGSHSFWETCYQVTCSVLRLETFGNYLGPQYYFPENFRCIFRSYESENFSDCSLHRIFESENFRFPFSMKNRQT